MNTTTFAARVERVTRAIDLSRFPSPITVTVNDYSPGGGAAEVVLSMKVAHVNTRFPTTVSQSSVLDHAEIQRRAQVSGTFDRAVVAAVWDMAKRLVLHEMQECLFFDGHQVSDPHEPEKDDAAKRVEMRRMSAGGHA